jgi:hypothetical protein
MDRVYSLNGCEWHSLLVAATFRAAETSSKGFERLGIVSWVAGKTRATILLWFVPSPTAMIVPQFSNAGCQFFEHTSRRPRGDVEIHSNGFCTATEFRQRLGQVFLYGLFPK